MTDLADNILKKFIAPFFQIPLKFPSEGSIDKKAPKRHYVITCTNHDHLRWRIAMFLHLSVWKRLQMLSKCTSFGMAW